MASDQPQATQQSPPHMAQRDARNPSSLATEPSSSQNLSNLAESAVMVDTPQDVPSVSTQAGAKTHVPTTSTPDEAEPRHCWICLQDEGIDSPESSQWRSPCPCNLQAHEECLLEWISDIQSPSGSGGGRLNQKVLCPQCKAEIKIERPIELIVAVTDLLSAIGRQLLFPTGAGMLIGCLYSGSMVYGFNVIQLIFGADDARRLLFNGRSSPSTIRKILPDSFIDWFFTLLRLTDPFVPTAGGSWIFGISPLIAPGLLLSRTRIADRTFSLLPVMYLMFPQNHQIPHWPPTPGLALATLPYIRSAYNELYTSIFADLEKSWDLAVQRRPREGETAEDVAHEQVARANEADNILGIEVEIINVEEVEEEEGDEGERERERNRPNLPGLPLVDRDGALIHPDVQPPNDERPEVDQPQDGPQQAEQPQGAAPAGQPNAADPAAPNEGWEFRQNISTAQVARTMIGALFFPAVSSLMGDLIFRTLPSTWVMKPVKKYSIQQLQATGLLQEKWGRSIVGGCLFVVLKDALTLYCKWRKAKNQGKRKVLDFIKKDKEGKRNQTAS